jgi:hypothetical protein
MTEQNSMPIPYRLVEPLQAGWQFKRSFAGKAASWAEADSAQAASALRAARSNPELRISLAARGARDLNEKQGAAWSGHYLPQLMKYLDASDRPRLRTALVRQVRRMEIKDPTLRKLNFGMLFGMIGNKARGAFRKPGR